VLSVDSLLGRNSFDLVGVKSCHDDISVVNLGDAGDVVEPSKSMFHPILIVSLWEIVSGLGTARLLSILSGIDCHLSLKKKVLEFKGLDQVSVPNVSSVRNTNVLVLLRDVMELIAALF